MPDREKVIKDLEECLSASCRGFRPRVSCPYNDDEWDIMRDVLCLLKEQEVPEELKHRMWNALYAEEDRFEKKFIGTDAHDAWFNIYRPWLQRGFEIAIKVIAHWEDHVKHEPDCKKPTLVWPVAPKR